MDRSVALHETTMKKSRAKFDGCKIQNTKFQSLIKWKWKKKLYINLKNTTALIYQHNKLLDQW